MVRQTTTRSPHTILVNTKARDKHALGEPKRTKQSKLEAGATMAHEYEHIQHRGGQPIDPDPVTNALPCGSCEHAEMFNDLAFCMLDKFCTGVNPLSSTTDPTIDELCDALEMSFGAAEQALGECIEEGCSGANVSQVQFDLEAAQLFADSCCNG